MLLILDVTIACDNPPHIYHTVRKELDTDLVPMVGAYLEDTAFGREPRLIERVTMNPANGFYHIGWQERGKDREECERLKRMYISHNWTDLEVK